MTRHQATQAILPGMPAKRRIPALIVKVPAKVRQAPPPVRLKFRAHLVCLLASMIMLAAGLILPAGWLVICSPLAESIALATVERLFAL